MNNTSFIHAFVIGLTPSYVYVLSYLLGQSMQMQIYHYVFHCYCYRLLINVECNVPFVD